ncbi:hypothetical protein R1sor_018351 [Riccia sorocarpa]|uniref:Peptidase S8/S53 domain-containing protein n=1 Tax=Riccia sorocarpa TaxID=122646 RepID=A0ABD3IB47_9MARC
MDLRWFAVICVFMFVPSICGDPRLEEEHCEFLVRSWAEKELAVPQTQRKLVLRDLLFFLHIPRTGGRTYYQCFLKQLFGSGERCPKSYDKLRFDTSQPGCRLISTHDDYSIMEKLPHGKASVVTNLRDPVSRVLSSYEFSVEVAARFLRHYKQRTNLRRPGPAKINTRLISTLDIWPWKYLVPFFQNDIFSRREVREREELIPKVEVTFKNSYDVDSLVMPFHEFIYHPIAYELVHNGATLQVAGLTNNSYIKEAREIRACVVDYEHLGHWVLDVAKRRLDDMIYVGLTERQEESVSYFASILRGQISSQEAAGDPQTTDRRLLDAFRGTRSRTHRGTTKDMRTTVLHRLQQVHSSMPASTDMLMELSKVGLPRPEFARWHKVCWNQGGCYQADIAAAIEDAILDGVDVLSISISGQNDGRFSWDSVGVAAFQAMRNNITVSFAAGNSGPGLQTVNHVEPWSITVAATTQDRYVGANVSILPYKGSPASAGLQFRGMTISSYPNFTAPIVLASQATYDDPDYGARAFEQRSSDQFPVIQTQEKPLRTSSEQTDVAQKQEPSWLIMQGVLVSYFGAFAVFFTLSAFALFMRILRKKKSVRERTPIRLRHPLFMKVHEKV